MPRLLTDRQGDVLRLLCAGMTTRDAARELGIARAVVHQHLGGARARLGPGTPAELCARAPDDIALAERRRRERLAQTD